MRSPSAMDPIAHIEWPSGRAPAYSELLVSLAREAGLPITTLEETAMTHAWTTDGALRARYRVAEAFDNAADVLAREYPDASPLADLRGEASWLRMMSPADWTAIGGLQAIGRYLDASCASRMAVIRRWARRDLRLAAQHIGDVPAIATAIDLANARSNVPA